MAGLVAKSDRVKVYIAVGGAEFKIADKIGKLTTVGDISSTTEEIDVTTLESDTKEFELGFTDSGSLEITQNLTSTEYDKMMALKESDATIKVGITVEDKAGEVVVGRSCAKAMVLSVTLGGMGVGGVLTVNTSIRLSAPLVTGFVAPIA